MILIVCKDRSAAVRAGCGVTGRHRKDKEVMYWWPELGSDRLAGHRIRHLIIDSNAGLSSIQRTALTAYVERPPCITIDLAK